MDMEVGNEMKSSTTLFVMNTVLNGSKRWNEICNVRSKWNDMCEGSSNWSESHDERRFIHDGISNQNKNLTRELSTEMKFAMMTWNLCTMEVATEMKFAMQVPQVMKSVIKIATQMKITMESGS